MVTLSIVGVGVGVGVAVGGTVGSVSSFALGTTGTVGEGLVTPPLFRLMEMSTTTAKMTATSRMAPKMSCQRAYTAALWPEGVDISPPGVGPGTRSLWRTRRVPQDGQRPLIPENCRPQRRQVTRGI